MFVQVEPEASLIHRRPPTISAQYNELGGDFFFFFFFFGTVKPVLMGNGT